jgi:hypothetical protein
LRRTACVVFALCAPAAYAHHGFGTFDMTKEIEITGTVTDLAFINPHSWLYLDVTGADGKTVAMKCEMRSATTLRRSGWVPELFPVGEKVTIKGSPDRNVPTSARSSSPTAARSTATGNARRPSARKRGRARRGSRTATRTLQVSGPPSRS